MFYPFDQLHFIIINADEIIAPDIFINKIIVTHFADNLKVHSTGIVFVGFWNKNALRIYGIK